MEPKMIYTVTEDRAGRVSFFVLIDEDGLECIRFRTLASALRQACAYQSE